MIKRKYGSAPIDMMGLTEITCPYCRENVLDGYTCVPPETEGYGKFVQISDREYTEEQLLLLEELAQEQASKLELLNKAVWDAIKNHRCKKDD